MRRSPWLCGAGMHSFLAFPDSLCSDPTAETDRQTDRQTALILGARVPAIGIPTPLALSGRGPSLPTSSSKEEIRSLPNNGYPWGLGA